MSEEGSGASGVGVGALGVIEVARFLLLALFGVFSNSLRPARREPSRPRVLLSYFVPYFLKIGTSLQQLFVFFAMLSFNLQQKLNVGNCNS